MGGSRMFNKKTISIFYCNGSNSRQYTYKCNNEARTRNNYCRGKAISIAHFCVCVEWMEVRGGCANV